MHDFGGDFAVCCFLFCLEDPGGAWCGRPTELVVQNTEGAHLNNASGGVACICTGRQSIGLLLCVGMREWHCVWVVERRRCRAAC